MSTVNSGGNSSAQLRKRGDKEQSSTTATTTSTTKTTVTTKQDSDKEPLPLSVLLLVFVLSISIIFVLFFKFPSLSEHHKSLIRFPRNFQDVKTLGDVFSQYTDDNYFIVITTFGFIYIFLQAFSIPGSVFLSFLSGGLFGIWVGFPLVCFVATIGATLSYLISYYICRNIVKTLFPQKLQLFSEQVSKQRNNLFNYIIFLRITPFLPNWFINLASPLLDVPISTFSIGTFIGIMPATFLAVKAGLSIQEIQKPSDIFDLKSILTMALLAILSILPTLDPVKKRLDKLLNIKNV
ncbi:hypothetical protein CYY_005164 [Polysphondylium violaceum]|uniref:VTT domain-containing protein n=1 Tax=Polysphondylium violaceum TaxID=133409 RepID=A0A8J4V732_9MYCE|nr:hypothetical protein CYY_005164 [Polysphondylium violaceum]